MGALLKFILLFIIVFYLFRLAGKLIIRLAGNQIKKKQYEPTQKREGEIHVNHKPESKGGKYGKDFKGGEYVDYEEVK